MTELEKIFLTSAVTIFGGMFVYVAGQLLSKFLIEPTHELKKTIGEVRFNLAFYAPIIHTPISRNHKRSQETYDALMKSSCDLLVRVNAIPFYSNISRLSRGFLPPKQNIDISVGYLRVITTYVFKTGDDANDSIEQIKKMVKQIEEKLGLEPLN